MNVTFHNFVISLPDGCAFEALLLKLIRLYLIVEFSPLLYIVFGLKLDACRASVMTRSTNGN